jgi:hypothetical protein
MEILTKDEFDRFSSDIKNQLFELQKTLYSYKPQKILKNKELKEYLGCSYSTIDKLRQSKILPYKKVLGNYYYSIDEVNKLFLN